MAYGLASIKNRLSDLELAFKFVCTFIIREGALYSNKVENLFVFTVVADMSPNQLSIPHYAPYLWPTLKQKVPLTFYRVHLFLLKWQTNPLLVKDINHGFEQVEAITKLLISSFVMLPLPYSNQFHPLTRP